MHLPDAAVMSYEQDGKATGRRPIGRECRWAEHYILTMLTSVTTQPSKQAWRLSLLQKLKGVIALCYGNRRYQTTNIEVRKEPVHHINRIGI